MNSARSTTSRIPFTHREFRDAVGQYASSVTVVTAQDVHDQIGTTCQSFFSQSLDPPLIALSFRHESASLPRFLALGRFCANVLARDQSEVSDRFARDGDRWSATRWVSTRSGNPRLTGVSAWFDCTVETHLRVGDHTILVGRVVELGVPPGGDREPIVFYGGRYRSLGRRVPGHRPAIDCGPSDDEIWAVLHG